jgi:hypothetical protein
LKKSVAADRSYAGFALYAFGPEEISELESGHRPREDGGHASDVLGGEVEVVHDGGLSLSFAMASRIIGAHSSQQSIDISTPLAPTSRPSAKAVIAAFFGFVNASCAY